MEHKHKELLRKNRTQIVKELENVDDILDRLIGPQILTDGMKEEIEVKPTKEGKVRELMDKIPRRGPAAFREFCAALWPENPHLAILLDPERSYKDPADTDSSIASYNAGVPVQVQDTSPSLPTVWPVDSEEMDSVSVVRCESNSYFVKKHFISERVYPFAKSPRGRVLVINNENFTNEAQEKYKLRDREGTHKDRENIKKLFEALHFDVKILDDQTAEQIKKAIDDECRDSYHANADCFVMVVMTHGDTKDNVDIIYGKDGQWVGVKDDILVKFEKCEYLRDKPKVFLFQACRGTSKDAGNSASYSELPTGKEYGVFAENLSEEFGELSIKHDSPDGNTESDAKVDVKVPTKADILVATATTAGTVSWRNTQSGSWFIQAIVYVFKRDAHEDDIDSMLKTVNNLVSRGVAQVTTRGKGKEEFVTVSEYRSTLRKKLYFFPGIYHR